MMRHFAGGHLAGHQETEHVLGRHTVPGHARRLPESETAVEGWISDQDTPAGSPGTQRVETGFDERASDPLALASWPDRHRPEQKPARRGAADICGRECDMTHHLAVRLSDQRHLQSGGGPQRLHDEMLRLLTVGVTLESGDIDLTDAIEITIGLSANDHADPFRLRTFSSWSSVGMPVLPIWEILSPADQAAVAKHSAGDRPVATAQA